MYSVMWSEHCSYKSTKVHLKQFSEIPQETPVGKMLAGIGENAGVLDIGQGYAVTFKVESHNHPSFVEPYQGAATGVGGIVRDILAMGARPVAVMDPLRFGPLDAPDTARVLPGIVAGVGGYGNCLGLPNIGGEAVFDETYAGNPLVNALCVGVLRHEDLHLANATGTGNQVVLYGARTGGDGIGGVSVLASETFDEGGPAKRPSVQVGDPFMEKLLIECTLELFAAGVIAGIQDLGGAGLSCATSELASAGDGGMHVELDRVPLRDSTLAPGGDPHERVAGADDGGRRARRRRRLHGDLREVGRRGRGRRRGHRHRAAAHRLARRARGRRTSAVGGARRPDLPPPVRPARLAGRAAGRRRRGAARGRPTDELRDTLLRLVASPNLCDKSWITDQYDRYVQGNTVLAQPADSGMVRVDADTNLGVSVSTDCNGRFAKLDPYTGAQLALAESFRNVATGGARPLAVSDCLNFGSPEDPDVMWQFAEACRGLKDACLELGIPVTGGNVSLYNQTGETAILPTPVVAVLGVIEDVTRRTPTGFGAAGERVFLLGETREELSGSEWAHVVARPPRRPAAAARPRRRAGAGLAAAGRLARRRRDPRPRPVRRRAGPGAGSSRPSPAASAPRSSLAGDAFVALFSESTARVLVTVTDEQADALVALAEQYGVPITPLGRTGGDALASRASSTSPSPRRRRPGRRPCRRLGSGCGASHRRRHHLGRRRLRPLGRRREGRLAGDPAGGPRRLRYRWEPQLERRIARTPTTSPSAATTAAPARPARRRRPGRCRRRARASRRRRTSSG